MKILESIVVSFQFLTRLYIPINVKWDSDNLRRSLLWFGLVGFFIGGILALTLKFGEFIGLQTSVISIIALIVWLYITGAMHIDGISDMADGFFSNRDKEKTLEIMKDSHVGAFGVIAIVFVLLTKFEMIKEFLLSGKSLFLMIFPTTFARLSAGFVLSFYETTKKSGIGYTFHSSKPGSFWLAGFLISTIISVIVFYKSILFILLSFIVSNLMAIWANKKIGGLNGDIYGAIVEIVEIVGLIFICTV